MIVLALPRGGVPVGFEIATALGVPLDVFLVRKLGQDRQWPFRWREETAATPPAAADPAAAVGSVPPPSLTDPVLQPEEG